MNLKFYCLIMNEWITAKLYLTKIEELFAKEFIYSGA